MREKNPAQKAWRTMRSSSRGKKAAYTKRRKAGAKKTAAKLKDKQWEPEKRQVLSRKLALFVVIVENLSFIVIIWTAKEKLW